MNMKHKTVFLLNAICYFNDTYYDEYTTCLDSREVTENNFSDQRTMYSLLIQLARPCGIHSHRGLPSKVMVSFRQGRAADGRQTDRQTDRQPLKG